MQNSNYSRAAGLLTICIGTVLLINTIFTESMEIVDDGNAFNPIMSAVVVYFIVLGIMLMRRSVIAYWLSISSVLLLNALAITAFMTTGISILQSIPFEFYPRTLFLYTPVIVPLLLLIISIPLLTFLIPRTRRN